MTQAVVEAGVWVSEEKGQAVETTQLSLVIPTRNEADNIYTLLSQLAVALDGVDAEVIFVDDSDDKTPDCVRAVADQFPFRVVLIARPPERRRNGLGGAVVEGFSMAQSTWLGVMDADLQHPPSIVPQLLAAAEKTGADLVLGSRLIAGGDTQGLGRRRTLVSKLLALTTRMTFPMRLWRVSDPLTGLFILRNHAVDFETLQPDGFKILLEILVRSPKLKLAEVPFHFDERHAGDSKASVYEVFRLIRHYLRLRISADSYLTRFLLAGFTGLFVNNSLLIGLTRLAGLNHLLSAIAALQASSAWTFFLSEKWVFDDRRERRSLWARLSGFYLMNNATLLVHLPLMRWLMRRFGFVYTFANLIALMVMTLVRFMISDQILWKRLKYQPLTRRKNDQTNRRNEQ